MAITVRKNVDELVLALAYALNSMQTLVVEDGYSVVHRDLTQSTTPVPVLNASTLVVTTLTANAPTATNLATTLVLANQELGLLNTHMFDAQAHLIKDLVNQPGLDGYVPINPANFTDGGLAEVIVNLNAMALLLVAHQTQAGVHVHNDTSVYTLTPCTNLATAETLANQLATAINHHMGLAGPNTNTPRINIIEM